ncbi:ATP-binding cassette domain-containing protein, partial [Enterococcus faecium]|nr:ATP-binding cassette domain-containing protein [Enterococcus faecium]
MTDILTIKNGRKVVNNGMNEEKVLLDEINLTIREGDFITVLGGNGAGKSTLFNTIAGTLQLSQGSISFKDQLITKDSEEKRARFLSRVFQDPKMGTAPRMTVAENLLLAQKRGQKRKFRLRNLKNQKEDFFRLCQEVGNGLE